MNAISFFAIRILIFVLQVFAITLPCEFSFDNKYGYKCRVGDISIDSHHIKITKIGGDHVHEKNKFNRTDRDVLCVIMYDRKIDYLPVNITFYFPLLKTLQVKKCGLKALTRPQDFRTLRRLYFGFNEIKNIRESYFWHFCRLETLSLHGNQIKSIPLRAFRDLISLKRLSLNGNHLKSIKSILFANCLNLEYIDLDNNALSYIESSLFQQQSRLKYLLMRNNQIKAIESGFLSTLVLQINSNEINLVDVLFDGNNCITKFRYPRDGDYNVLQNLFSLNCSTLFLNTIVESTDINEIDSVSIQDSHDCPV